MRTIIEAAIRAQTAEWIANGTISCARDVGDGLCEEFAQALLGRLPTADGTKLLYSEDWWARLIRTDGTPCPNEAETFFADIPRLRQEGAPLPTDIDDYQLACLLGSATHVWLSWNDIHFDASAPQGCDHWLLMPFYADQISGLRQALAEKSQNVN